MLPSRVFFDSFFDDLESPKKLESVMKCDIYEKDGLFNIEMDIPGFKKEDIKIELNDGYLTISAEKQNSEENEEDKNYIRRERHYEKAMRQFYVGDIDESAVKAEFKDGMLKVSLPKEEKEKETKKMISID